MSSQDPGCRASIRHPSNVKPCSPQEPNPSTQEKIKVLSCGIDTLVLSIEVFWENKTLFKRLEALQETAKEEDCSVPVELCNERANEMWTGLLHPYGMRGYQWIITGKEYSLRIGNWMRPKARPSVVVEIRSETLWHLGPKAAVDRIVLLLEGSGARILSVKPSRADLCADIVLPLTIWDITLMGYRVTRAVKAGLFFNNDEVEGMAIGKGDIQARLYDKVLEIKQKDEKQWMFDVWQIEVVHPDERVIRVEFQLRREVIRELGIDVMDDFWPALANLWAYCTQNWLKFQDNPGKHHTQRRTLPWWKLVQKAFTREQEALPLIRCKALSIEERKHFAQTFGCFTSLAAALAENGWIPGRRLEFVEALERFRNLVIQNKKGGMAFLDELDDKLAKQNRDRRKILETMDIRNRFNLPDNLKLDWMTA